MLKYALAALMAVAAATPAVAGPPWISIELPANPYDAATRNAFLVVHAFHHGMAVAFPVDGTAEGIVNGERRTIQLKLTATSRTGEYALERNWPSQGTWTLVIRVHQGDEAATAIVELGSAGDVASVRVPTMQRGDWTVPAVVSLNDIEGALRARVASLASKN
jgi:hypothetical protein